MKFRAVAASFTMLACIMVGVVFNTPRASADLPFLRTNGSLASPGDRVVITGLTGQSTCAFYEIGTPGATDVYGSTDSSTLTTNLTPISVTDYANPPNVQSAPFTPSAGITYVTVPSSMAQLQIVADATWSGSAQVYIACSSSVARGASSGGGGGSVVGVEPIYTPASNQVGFDYSYSGVFRYSTQTFGYAQGTCEDFRSVGGIAFTNYLATPQLSTIYMWADPNGLNGYSVKNDCSAEAQWLSLTYPQDDGGVNLSFAGNIDTLLLDAATLELNAPVITLTQLSDGSLCLVSDTVTTTDCPGGTSYTPGPNVTFSPAPGGSPVAIALASVPILEGVEFTPAPDYSPGTLAGFASAGDGNSKLVSVSVSPCPTAGGCVVSVTGGGLVNCTGISIVTCQATPNPTCTGAVSCTGTLAANNLVIDVPTPAPAGASPYPTPIVTTSPSPGPLTFSTSVVAGATVYTAAFGIVPAFDGGLGLNATTFSNGQCPAYSTSLGHFAAAACGGGTYTAGTNIGIASNVVSLASPLTSPISVVSSSTNASLSVGDNAANATSQVYAWTNASPAPATCSPSSGYQKYTMMCIVQNSGQSVIGLTGGSGGSSHCFMQYLATGDYNFTTGCPFEFTGNAPLVDAATSSTGACFSSTKALVSCSSGQATCSLSSNACSATATVTAHSQCTATMDSGTAAGNYYAPQITQPGSGTTLTITVTAVLATGTAEVDYRC